MAEQWHMVRIKMSTFVMLKEARRRMQVAYERGQLEINDPTNGGQVSFDTAVFMLVMRDQEHAKRRARHSAKKRQAKKTAGGSCPPAGANPER